MTIYDLTDAQVAYLATVADDEMMGRLLKLANINSTLQTLIGEFKSITAPQSVEISAGVVTVERLAKINVIQVETEGAALATDDLDTVAWSGTGSAIAGDRYIFFIQSAGRRVNFTSSGNMNVKNSTVELATLDSVIEFVVAPDLSLSEVSRYPATDTADTAPSSATVFVDASDTIFAAARVLTVYNLSGETLAQGSVTIDLASSYPCTVAAWIDEGNGPFVIGSYTAIPADTPYTIADGLRDSINLGAAYTAATALEVCTITAPVGTGATANAYTLTTTLDGTITTTIAAMGAVTVGVDGTEAAGNLDTITGGEDGPYYIFNGMSAATLTLVTGGNIITGVAVAAQRFVLLLKIGANFALSV